MLESLDWLLALGAGSCAIGGLLAYSCRKDEQFLDILKNVKELVIDGTLDSKLESNGRVLPYVSVQGNVCADGNVLHSQSPHESHEGVIRKTEILEHKASWNATFENWSHQEKRVAPAKWDEEPFSLICEGSNDTTAVRVHVDDVTCCHRNIELATTHDHFQSASAGFGDALGALIKGEYTKGYRTVEQMLLINTARTVIGELVKTNDSKYVIRAPRNSSLRYYITSGGVQTVIAEETATIKTYRFLSLLLCLIGSGACAYWVYRRYKRYRGERLAREEADRMHMEMADFDANVEDVRVCSICMSQPRNVVFLPCGHVCACVQCGSRLPSCPVCRRVVQSTSAIYFS